ncbi:thiamine-phosphate kinase [Acuticoccus mangrovi]|uniref:Thiamine-monophosphate kinase n=1 Tax=Acuticoccus mangrovi TaxID=2796142 RepID=A0A934INI1_9HYPH|nr:thiamine-phosphate kinase [Acuticoccus mangrovi]MBJ3778171.1 thiamine-phosphate kinase [Acuticoccus mangrovi]
MDEPALDEDGLIARVFAPLATAAGADALGDDAATFLAGSEDIVVTSDALAAGVHFFADDPPEAIAAKALRVNLSDLAAKGAEPFAYLLALALGEGWSASWAERFAASLRSDHARYGVTLLGGDTLRASPGGGTTIAITALGRVPHGRIVRRRSARPGEIITVTGTIGDAALGLLCRLGTDGAPFGLDAENVAALREAYLWPDPPVEAWRAVQRHAMAAMDVSDGLVGDLRKLCRTAAIGARIEADSVPLSPAVRAAVENHPAAFDKALTGGDDYQILATLRPSKVEAYMAELAELGLSATVIGEIVETPGLSIRRRGVPIDITDGRFQHF